MRHIQASVTLLVAFLSGFVFVIAASANEDPQPFNKIVSDGGETILVEGLGATRLGRVPVVAFKIFDFAREIGEVAVEREDKTLGAEMMLMKSDAALIGSMARQGIDINTDQRALAARSRLKALADRAGSADESSRQHLWRVVKNNFAYTTAKLSFDQALKFGAKQFLQSNFIGRTIKKVLPLGDEFAEVIGNRSALKPVLNYVGWSKFGTRAASAGRFVDKLTKQIIDAKVERLMTRRIATASEKVLDNLYSEVMAEHLPQPVKQTRMRLVFMQNPELLSGTYASSTFASFARDPVARTIYTEDNLQRSANAQAQERPDPKDEARHRQLHEELMRVGDGKTNWNNGSWDGNKGGTLTNK